MTENSESTRTAVEKCSVKILFWKNLHIPICAVGLFLVNFSFKFYFKLLSFGHSVQVVQKESSACDQKNNYSDYYNCEEAVWGSGGTAGFKTFDIT